MPRSRKDDEFAALLSRAASPESHALIDNVCHEVTAWEREKGVRSNERRAVTGARFREALERLLGDLLRARAEPSSTGRIYRAVRPNDFSKDVVSYRHFKAAVDALSGLKLLEVTPGKSRYMAAFGTKWTVKYRASRFRATQKLIQRATDAGVVLSEIDQHFRLEPPRHPLVLKAASIGKGARKLPGPRMDVPQTTLTERLEAEVIKINEFLSGFEVGGAIHYGFVRIFNEGNIGDFDWNRGGLQHRSAQLSTALRRPARPDDHQRRAGLRDRHPCMQPHPSPWEAAGAVRRLK
jgi:hypothetical protein